MAENIGEDLINTVNFDSLINKLIELMVKTLIRDEYEPEDKHIIDSALELFVSCLMHKSELIEAFYNYNQGMDVSEFTVRALTYPKTILVRRAFG